MRELAVQAANGIYTADDRQAIQLEVGQLVNEINRISETTEFNTKTLLDGTLGALISTDDYTKVRAAVVGEVGKGGNFVMKAVAKTTGQLQVQKTDVFATTLTADAVGKINYLNTWRADATITTAGPDGVGNTGISKIEVPNSANGSVAVNSQIDGTFTIYSAAGAGSLATLAGVFQADEIGTDDKIMITLQTASSVVILSVAVSSTLTLDGLSDAISTALATYTTAVIFDDAVGNHYFDMTMAAGVTVLATEFVDVDGSGGDMYLSFGSTGTSNLFFDDAQYSFSNNGATTGALTLTAAAGPLAIGNAGTGAADVKFDVRFNFLAVASFGVAAGAVSARDTIAWNRYTGDNSIQDYGKVWQTGAASTNGTFLVSAITNRTYAMFEFDNAKYTSLVSQGWDQTLATTASRGNRISQAGVGAATFTVNETFEGSSGSALENINFTVDGIMQIGETATFNVSTNNVLTGDQLNTLQSLNRFQEFGVFNGRNTLELTVYLRGTDHAAVINLSKNDTLEDMAGKISLAIWNPNGGGVINSAILTPAYAPDLVHVNTIGMAKGTVSIVSPVPGADIVFAGDESLLKALSLVEVQEGMSPVYSVSAFNLEQGVSVGSVVTDSNEIVGLLPGLKVFFDNTLGLNIDPQPPGIPVGNSMVDFAYPLPIERPVISLSNAVESFFIHVAPRDFTLQVGANEGQTIASYISDMSARALGVEGLLVVTSDLAQDAISTVDHAIGKVSGQRSRLGALQNRLESTIRNLDVAAENLVASESRIRDVDVALETVTMTRNQILLQAGVAALAQANQLPQAVLQLLR
jgi:flagellin